MRKILFIITDINGSGGTEKTTSNLASTFKQNGWDVTVVSVFNKKFNYEFKHSLEVNIKYVINKEYNINKGGLFRIKMMIAAMFKLKKILKHNVDNQTVIVAQTFLPSFLVFINKFSKKTYVCEHYEYGVYSKIVCKVRDYVYRRFKGIILLTNAEINLYLNANKNISVIPNMTFRHCDTADITTKRIIAAGRFSLEKGFDFLIEAAPKVKQYCPDWSIEIYGDGDKLLYEQYVKRIKELDVEDYIHFNGFTLNLHEEMSKSAIFVLPSRFEALPMVILEAMSIGLPVVAFDCAYGIHQLLINGAGVLLEPENIEELSNALIRTAKDTQLREEMSKKGLEQVQEFYPENIYNKWMNLINNN